MDMARHMAVALNQSRIQETPQRTYPLAGHHTHPGFCLPPWNGHADNLNARYHPDRCIILATCLLQLVISIKYAAASNVRRIEDINTPEPTGSWAVQLDAGIQHVGLLSLFGRCYDRGYQRLRTSLSCDRYLE